MIKHSLFVFSALALYAVAGSAALANPLDTATPAPAWTKTMGTIQVQKFGAGSPALILVPGLGCGPWTWRSAIAHESKTHAVYSLTLAGFDGMPFEPNAGLDSAEAGIENLITAEKLVHPILVGHSLGGYLVLRFGTEHPDQAGGIVSVDGLPVLPQFADLTADQRQAQATQIASTIAKQTPDEFKAAEAKVTADYVTDPALAALTTALVQRSDQQAMAEYSKQLFAADLRPQLPKLTTRTAIFAPIPSVPLPSYLPPPLANMSQDVRTEALVRFYTQIMTGAPLLQVIPIENARHFISLDQPEAFEKALDKFIAGGAGSGGGMR